MTLNYFAAASFALWVGAAVLEVKRGNYLLAALFATWAASSVVATFIGGK